MILAGLIFGLPFRTPFALITMVLALGAAVHLLAGKRGKRRSAVIYTWIFIAFTGLSPLAGGLGYFIVGWTAILLAFWALWIIKAT
jgi:hypothetical protein